MADIVHLHGQSNLAINIGNQYKHIRSCVPEHPAVCGAHVEERCGDFWLILEVVALPGRQLPNYVTIEFTDR